MAFIIFIVSVLSFAFTSTYFFNKNQKVKRRIEQLISTESQFVQLKEKTDSKAVRKSPLQEVIKTLAKNIKTSDSMQSKLETELESAGIPLKVEEFITVRLVLLGIAVIGSVLIGLHLLFAILIGLMFWKLPTLYLKRKKEARIAALAQQLPQALETMASAMKSGFSFMQAMQLVSKEMPDPIGIEFKRTIKEINLGVSLEQSFENLLTRVPNKDLEIVITAVLIQRTTGGNLAQILETIHETISERVRMKDELKALTSQGRISALVITLLPVLLGLILNIMNPDYFTPMLSTPLGWALIGGGILSGALGWIVIQKVITIEV